MRPLKLTMQAFGPYQEQETVDFTELGPNRVFLIHGDTGAGKTTILDAMVFALYGDTSGGERRADQMRCESAPADLPTEVTFDFTLGSEKFRVRRRPAQERLGARGARVTKQAEATLWDRTGCTDDQEGKPLTTKITEANALIKDHLGFSCEQFRQVVVLPQGRFRELLSAGSDKREEILRQLFRSERFRQLEEALFERAKAVRQRMGELRSQREAQLGLVEAAGDAELVALMNAAASELDAATTWVGEAGAASRQADDALTAAEAADEAQTALVAARADLERLQALEGDVQVVKGRVESALRADKVQPAADRLADARRQVAAAAADRQEADQALGRAREAEQAAVESLAAQNERLPQREAASANLHRLEGLTAAIAAWRTAQDEATDAQGRAVAARRVSDEAAESAAQAGQALLALGRRREAATAAAAQVEGAYARYEGIKQHEDRCRRLLAARDAVEAAENDRAGLGVAERAALEVLNKAESGLVAVEERWRAGRAAALAAGLIPGSPCPVCGATDHPVPARAREADVSDDGLSAAKSAADQARRLHSQAHEATARASNEVTAALTVEQSIRREPGARPDMVLAWAESAVAACRAELDELSARAELGELEIQIAATGAASTEAAARAKTAAEALVSEEKALAAIEARLSERVALVPEELRGAGALEDAIVEARRTKKALDESLEAAQRALSEAKESRIALESAATAAAAAQSTAAQHESTCVAGLQAALEKNGFAGEEGWRGSLLSEPERAGLQAEVEAYGTAVQQARGRAQQAELALAGQSEPADLVALRVAAEAARSAHGAAISRQADARNAVAKLAKVRQSVDEIDARSEDVRRAYETVGVLSLVANGDNPGRVSFQRWVLGVYLDEVLVGASRKLFSMSKGRYQLRRQRETTGGRRPAGLDLAVFDEFSGTARPAVTLSGGESFLAALALALGLAETVQEHAAGVPLETIFVDEGFGALDSDALELAIDALMELQLGGRLVGVISHVPELRQVIPARLEVLGGSGGSSTRFIVP